MGFCLQEEAFGKHLEFGNTSGPEFKFELHVLEIRGIHFPYSLVSPNVDLGMGRPL